MKPGVLLVGAPPALTACLSGLEVALTSVARGSEALEALCDGDACIVAIARHLPDFDGVELAALIHGDEGHRHAAILLVASHDEWGEIAHRAHEVGIVDYVATPLRLGTVRGKLRVYIDLHEWRAREQLRLAHLERANRDAYDFAHAAAHDLRAPLRSVARHAAALRERGDPDAEVQRSVAAISSSIERMDRMLASMLDFARVDGAARVSEPVELDGCVREAWQDLQGAVDEARATLHLEPLPLVPGDTAQLRRVFQNIIANAVKYRRAGVAPVVRISCTIHGLAAQIDVRDNGTGFDMELHDEVFRPFRRLVPPRSGGTGLGMAIARRIVERHGGTISATSVIDEGTTFHVRLPMTSRGIAAYRKRVRALAGAADGELAPTTVLAPASARPPRVLVVDDCDEDRACLVDAIGDRFDVVVAASAEAALPLVGDDVVAVLSDYRMPGHNGLWLLAEIARTAAGIRRMLITGSPDGACDEAIATGIVDGVVGKPTAADELQRIVGWLAGCTRTPQA